MRIVRGNGLRAFLIRGFVGSGALKIVQTLLGFCAAILLARVLEPEGYGIYTFALSLSTLLAVPAQVGLPTLVVREVAHYQVKEQWGLLHGILRRSNQVVITLSALLVVAAASVAWAFFATETTRFDTFAFALVLLPLIALGNLRGATLRGFRKVIQGQLPEMLFRPGLLVLLVGTWLLLDAPLSPPGVMALHACAAGLAFAGGAMLLLRAVPMQVRVAQPEYSDRAWLRSVLPLSAVSGMHVINSQLDILMLGLLGSSEDVGIYRAAIQGATFVSFMLTAANVVVAPQISRLYKAGDTEKLQRMITWTSRIVLGFAVPTASVLALFGEAFLQRVFGTAYSTGHISLAVLCTGQVASAAMGSAGLLLNMTGHERDTAKALVVAVTLNVVLNLALIPIFGMEGAAAASAARLAFWNMYLSRMAYARTGISSSAFFRAPLPPRQAEK